MATRTIAKTSWELPPSVIYLDDLKAIEEIAKVCLVEDEKPLLFQYKVDSQYIMDSLEDLATHQGFARKLEIVIRHADPSRGGETIIDLLRNSSYLQVSSDRREEFISKVRDVFQSRKRNSLIVSEAVLDWMGPKSFLLWIVLLVIPAILILIAVLAGILDWKAGRTLIEYCFAVAVLLASSMWAIALPSVLCNRFRINLFYYRHRQIERRKSFSERLEKVLWLIVGVILTLLTQWIGGRLKH
jgi:hypothetical protein